MSSVQFKVLLAKGVKRVMNRKRREKVGKNIYDPKNIDQTKSNMQGSIREKIGEEERFERHRHRISKHLQFVILDIMFINCKERG